MLYRMRTSWWAAVALLLLMPLGACKSDNSSSDSTGADTERAQAEGADEEGEDDQQVEDAPPTDLYPGMNFAALKPEERVKFVDIAKAEVCPCEDAAESLHQCLQDEQTSCSLAQRVAGLIGMSIQQGFSEADILDRVASEVEAASKQHEFTLEDVPQKGPEDAEVNVVEFADFECPHCRMASGMLERVKEKYGDDITVYFKQFPLQAGSTAEMGARATLAAHQQDKFWEMHDLIFENQRALSADKFTRFARRLGLNVSKFQEAMNSQEVAAMVQRDKTEGQKAGITGTPAIFINGRRYMGDLSEPAVSQAIDAELAGDDEAAEEGEE
ncbi:MAG: DsbA family protein, partial [Persicimonas sp.]